MHDGLSTVFSDESVFENTRAHIKTARVGDHVDFRFALILPGASLPTSKQADATATKATSGQKA